MTVGLTQRELEVAFKCVETSARHAEEMLNVVIRGKEEYGLEGYDDPEVQQFLRDLADEIDEKQRVARTLGDCLEHYQH